MDCFINSKESVKMEYILCNFIFEVNKKNMPFAKCSNFYVFYIKLYLCDSRSLSFEIY